MMTLEEAWENLRQDPEIKSTMEEVEKSYKLFKKIENLIVADLEAKLEESEKTEDGAFWFEKWQHKKRDYDSVYKAYIENCAEVDQLKQQLAESENESNARYSAWQEEIGECDRLRVALTEKDQAIESLQEINQSLGQTCNNDAKEIERLREQLAEKEKEETKRMQDFEKGCQEYYKSNQRVIDELEKVKEWANNMYDGWKSNDGVNLDAKSGICNTLQAVCGMVNQQIKSLKGKK